MWNTLKETLCLMGEGFGLIIYEFYIFFEVQLTLNGFLN